MNKLTEQFVENFQNIDDPRTDNHNKRHELLDILVLTILAVICGADSWTGIEAFGKSKEKFLKKFLVLPHGIPLHDTLGDLFARINPEQLQKCFLSWINSLIRISKGEIIAIDGKSLCGSKDLSASRRAIHMVSAWATKNSMVLGQVITDSKSNEITAIPELLKALDITDCIVTIDAMGCQKKIAEQIKAQDGEYVLALKGNQGKLHEAVKNTFEIAEQVKYKAMVYSEHEKVDGDHGRIETRRGVALPLMYLHKFKIKWKGLQSLVMIDSKRCNKSTGEIQKEKRHYISSLPIDAEHLGNAIRLHWNIENNLHWCLDIGFDEDHCRARKDNSAGNLAVIRHIALNLLKLEKTAKVGIKIKRSKAGWDNKYLAKILGSAQKVAQS